MTGLLPTQRPLSGPQLEALLAPLGRPAHTWLMSGGTFSAVQGVELDSGETVVVKTSVPEALDEAGRSRLLGYEHDLLRAERDHLALVAEVPDVPAPRVLAEDFSRAIADVDALVMTLAPGMPWDSARDVMTPEANARAFEEVGHVVAALAAQTGSRYGLPARDFVLGGATMRGFMSALIASAADDARAWGVDIEADRLHEAVEAAGDALDQVETPSLVHADLWHGNVLVDPQTGQVTGVVDFERSLFGDPLWGLAGGETHASGAFEAAKVRGYEAATGRPLAMDRAAERRVALYRLWSMAVQLVEIHPRGFSGDWIAGHEASIRANRERLHAILDV
ncbi:aminoglycoside phosphotransferase family protein [Demequina sp. SYSU T00039]|uniref:Aminoglycoside phosphotransferase family protein n=1 Tax=Demequina lignilytica TaxID=3051663 RepID=A0AAW7M744_9MICO|nr:MULTISPECIES: aminoglycoside phosphotransferase family protein [unclassified Demequina]MDN4477045.1 aminoglycoside phosphotransferase family protein [Demequina sp. SYSU T00039-1]MDN4487218.1 aminoglycoside phosphotransferase family protein [Demequina sp. SYSU T00039]MDN4491787.1 aminoglycoside phosphotransferase family protein [Demequina sp. SYSU T00068]